MKNLNKYYKIFVVVLLLTAGNYCFAQPKIIIKLDDIAVKNTYCGGCAVFDDLLSKQIKTSIGVIAIKLDATAKPVLSKYINAKDSKGNNLFEVWCHGYDHSNNNPPHNNEEFYGTSYDFQYAHFNMADQAVLKYIGIQMHTFGAPFNFIDTNTIKVISKNKNYKVVIFSGANRTYRSNGIVYLNNRVDMENGAGNLNYDYFVTQYQKYKNKFPDYMILQGHPNGWDANKKAQFDQIIAYLIAQKCEFVLPYEYSKHVK